MRAPQGHRCSARRLRQRGGADRRVRLPAHRLPALEPSRLSRALRCQGPRGTVREAAGDRRRRRRTGRGGPRRRRHAGRREFPLRLFLRGGPAAGMARRRRDRAATIGRHRSRLRWLAALLADGRGDVARRARRRRLHPRSGLALPVPVAPPVRTARAEEGDVPLSRRRPQRARHHGRADRGPAARAPDGQRRHHPEGRSQHLDANGPQGSHPPARLVLRRARNRRRLGRPARRHPQRDGAAPRPGASARQGRRYDARRRDEPRHARRSLRGAAGRRGDPAGSVLNRSPAPRQRTST